MFAAVIDLDNGDEEIFADDVEIGDIIWMGPQPSVAAKAALAGVEKSSPYGALGNVVSKALAAGRPVHFVTPSRYYNTMKIASLLKCNDAEVAGKFSLALTKAIISMRGQDGGGHACERLGRLVPYYPYAAWRNAS